MTDADYTDNLVFLASTPAKSESRLHGLEQAAIDFYVNANKIEYLYFKQEGAMFTVTNKPLKLVDQFTYLDSSISSTESDDNIHIGRAWTIIDWLSVIRKSDL